MNRKPMIILGIEGNKLKNIKVVSNAVALIEILCNILSYSFGKCQEQQHF